MRTLAALLALGLAGQAVAAEPSANRRNFIACPMMRDTAEVPCWVASYGGELYFLGIQEDISGPFHPPQLKHKALVEGVVTDAPRICGGIVLKPVVVSVIPEYEPACNTILPAEGHRIDNPPRGPGPANRGKLAATDYNAPPPAPRPAGPALSGPQTFTVLFGHEGDYINVHQFQGVMKAAAYAKSSGGKVAVVGRRAATLLSDGKAATEKAGLEVKRTAKVVEALKGLGVTQVAASSPAQVENPTGVDDNLRRRVEITVTP